MVTVSVIVILLDIKYVDDDKFKSILADSPDSKSVLSSEIHASLRSSCMTNDSLFFDSRTVKIDNEQIEDSSLWLY